MLSTPHQLQAAHPNPALHLGASPSGEPAFSAWLIDHKDAMFRWALTHAGSPQTTPNPLARRAFAESSVAVQRRQGNPRFVTWLFGAMLLVAHRRQPQGGLSEGMVTGLPPELRGLLRLVGRGEMSPIEAWGLLNSPIDQVRLRLLRARLDHAAKPAEHQHH